MYAVYYAIRVMRNTLFCVSITETEDLRKLSRVLFGQTHRLAVMIGIARSSRVFFLADLAHDLGFENLSSIQDPIRDLETSELITRMPKAAQKVRFRRNKSLAWKWAEELAARPD
jgi:hypothetical protein